MAEKELTIKLNLKDAISKDLDDVVRQLRALGVAAEKVDDSLNDTANEQVKLANASRDAAKATLQVEKSILSANGAFDRSAKSTAKAAEALGDLNHMTDRADQIMAAFEDQLRQTEQQAERTTFKKLVDGLSDLGREAAQAGKKLKDSFSDIRKDLNDSAKFALGNLISDGFQEATQAAINFTKESVDVYLGFENTMIGVAKASGLPSEQLDLLATQLQDVAQAIGPATAQDMVEVAEAAARMGIGAGKLKEAQMAQELGDTAKAAMLFGEARDEITQFAETIGIANVALQGFPGGAEGIATSIAKILALYGQSSSYAEQYLSVVNRLDDTMAATAPQIVGFLEGFTSANSQWKMSQEQAAAYGATLVSLGQDPHDAATRLQSALTFLNRENGEAAGAFKRLAKQSPEFVKSLNEVTGASLSAASSGADVQNAYRKWMDTDLDGALQAISISLGAVDSSTERNILSTKLYGAVGARAMGGLSGSYADLVVGAEDAAAAFLSTEQGLTSLEKATGLVRTDFKTTADFIATAFKEKPEAAIGALIEEVQKIPEETSRVQTATELFGEKFGKSLAEGAKNGVQQLKEALDTSAADVKRYNETSVSSLATEMERVLASNQAKFDEFGGTLEKIQLIIGKDIVEALGSVLDTDLTPMMNDFATWLKTSEDARTLFETTLPGAIKMTVEVAKGVTTFLTTIHNTIVGIAEITGRLIDATSQVVGSQQELAGEFKQQAEVIGEYNAQVAQNIEQVGKYEQVVPQMQGMTIATEDLSAAAKSYNGILLDANYDSLLTNINALYGANQNLLVGNTAVETSMNSVFTALRDGSAPTAELEGQFTRLLAQFQAAGVSTDALKSAFPELSAGISETAFSTKNMAATLEALPLPTIARDAMAVSDGMKAVTSVNEQQVQASKAAAQAMTEESQAAKGAYDALKQISAVNRDTIVSTDGLSKSYVAVARGMESAMSGASAPTESLVASTERLVIQMQAAGINTAPLVEQLNALGKATMGADYAFEGGSLTPALRNYITAAIASNATTGELSASMVDSMKSVLAADEAYTQMQNTMDANQVAITETEIELRNLNDKLRSAGKEEKDGIRATITEYQNKRATLQNLNAELDISASAIKKGMDVEVEGIKEVKRLSEETAKAKSKANEELAKNTENTAKLLQKQAEDEMKTENALYQERQKAAADSVKWVGDLDDATKKRLLGEKDAVKALQEQGIVLTDLQQQEVRRLQGAYQTEAAYEAQQQALEKQLGVSKSLSDNLSSLGSSLSSIGDIFGSSGLSDIGGGLSSLPDALKGIKDSFGGLKEGLSGMGSGFSGLLDGFSSITGAISALATAWDIGKTIFEGIGSLFEDTKTKGTEATNAMQEFVRSGISGGAELAAAMGTGFDIMSASGFNYAEALERSMAATEGTRTSAEAMSQVMGGLSTNWQTGSTAMDVFTQSIGRATGDMQKAPQVALEMTMGMDAMGLSAEQAGAKMLEIATKAGMSTAEIEKLKAALQGGGEEGAVTAGVFDGAGMSVDALTAKTAGLSGTLSGVTAQLAGTGAEGALTTGIFGAADMAATSMNNTTLGLSGNLSMLTGQLMGAGAEGLATSNIFTVTQGTSAVLSGEIETLKNKTADVAQGFYNATDQAGNFAAKLSQLQQQAAQGFPSLPAFAAGGFPSGLAMVNERGSEIADVPGFGKILMTAPGPVLGAFPRGTEIIPHSRSMQILRDNPGLPRMATGGTVDGYDTSPIKVTVNITGNTFTQQIDVQTAVRQGLLQAASELKSATRRITR